MVSGRGLDLQPGFDLLNLVTQGGRSFVGLVLDRGLKFVSQFDQPELILARLASPLRHLAAMLRAIVYVFEQLIQLGLEHFIVVRTAQTALPAKLPKRDAAMRTRQLVDRLQVFQTRPGQRFLVVRVRLREILLSTSLAQMQLLNLTLANLGDVQSGRLGTATAFLHDVGPLGFRPQPRQILAVRLSWSRNGLAVSG